MKQGFFQGILSILFFAFILFPIIALGQDTTQPAPSFQIYTAPRILNVPQPSVPPEDTVLSPNTGRITFPEEETYQMNPRALCLYRTTKTKEECDQACMCRHYVCRGGHYKNDGDCEGGHWKLPHPDMEMMCQINLCNTYQTCKFQSGLCISGCPIPDAFLPDECK